MKNLTHSELSRRRLVPSKRGKRKQEDAARPAAEAAEASEGPKVAESESDRNDDHEMEQDQNGEVSEDGTGFETDDLKEDDSGLMSDLYRRSLLTPQCPAACRP